ncbi:MAG TPA: hypothetical protein EYG34_07800 [Acidimicrobiia bacterium]|jgi:hypothetical protein|nr:hypothetical protein [Acidimicrobiia bacterium]HIL47002.1 hypothetical protein [Acidimicrobiia bacterium]
MATALVTIFWRDIPAQITAQKGRTREKGLLDARFQLAIDQAAMVAGLTGIDDYVTQWRRESQPCSADLAQEVADALIRVDIDYPAERIKKLVRSGGLEPTEDQNS